MKTTTFTEFRKTASRVLDRVERAESIRIVRHGRVIASIIPAATSRRYVPAWKRPCQRIVIPGVSLSKAVLEERR
jgi:prevent-host-death family protein